MSDSVEREKLLAILIGCKKGSRDNQRMLYEQFYGYAMGVCLRYTNDREGAKEVVNDGFLKVFQSLHRYDFNKPFKAWLRQVMVHTAIDYFRKYQKNKETVDISYIAHLEIDDYILEKLMAKEIIEMVQKLPPSYRIVFNLYVLEGFTHKEIAEKLDIAISTSKSNLAKGKMKLKKMLFQAGQGRRSNFG